MHDLHFVNCNVPEEGWMTLTCCLCKHIWDCVMVKVIKNVISTFMDDDDDGNVCPVPDMDRLITQWKFHQDSWNWDLELLLNVCGVKYYCAILLGFLAWFGFNWLKFDALRCLCIYGTSVILVATYLLQIIVKKWVKDYFFSLIAKFMSSLDVLITKRWMSAIFIPRFQEECHWLYTEL